MSKRTDFEMTENDLAKLIEASRPVPLIALQWGAPCSRQMNVNNAWKELGERMGFDGMTVRPNGKGDRFFSAVSLKGDDNG